MTEKTQPNQNEVEELLKLLEDPDIGESVKSAIRDSLGKLASGGFKKAYETNLSYLARSDLNAYSEYVFEKKPYPHHKVITDILMDDTRTRELIIVPPGAGKSSYVATQYPTWYMGKYPKRNIILISATADHAEKACVSIRQIIDQHPKYKEVFPGIKKDEERGWTKSSLFLTEHTDLDNPNPNLFASGTQGPVIGKRAHLIIVDDPIKGEDANSAKKMEEVKLWIKETLRTRFHPGVKGKFIVILTRWSDKDLASMFVNEMGFRATVMPAVGDDGGAYMDDVLPDHELLEKPNTRIKEILENYKSEGHRAKLAFNEGFSRWCVRKYLHGEQSIWPTHMPMEELDQL